MIRRAYVDGPYGQLHYRRAGPEGTRSPLLLLHPCPGSSYLFEAFMLEMGRDRTVIAADLPGFGMSDPPPSAPGIAGYAGAMLDLEAGLGLGVFDIMGYHAGGSVGVEMARRQPNAVRKIVMIGAAMLPAEERADISQRFVALGPDERAAAVGANWPVFKTQFWRMGPDPVRTWNLYLDAQKNPEVSSWGIRAAVDYDLGAGLAAISQPVLVLNPDDDLADYTRRAATALKNGRVQDLPEWTHGMLDAKTAEVAAIVRGFLG
jgi:pimeloyl-ACP methyl ester carboxylesterase